MSPAFITEKPAPTPKRSLCSNRGAFGEGDVLAGKYRIEAVLGEGGMGIVLRATHLVLGCRVAIKVMRPELAQNQAAVERLMVEAQAAASIRSEHVARVLDVGELDSGAPFLVLEYLDGRDLANILAERGHLASHVAVDFVLQACQALSEAHGAGIVHRDLKPENLFVSFRADGTPIVKVLDFGISLRLTREGREAARTNSSELLGSPLYMAPEQMRASEDVDARADIWSLGVVLYELCTGQSPFFAQTIAAICGRVLGIEPSPPRALKPELDQGLERLILRCLHKDPAQRPANVAELASELAQYGSADAAACAQSALRVLASGGAEPSCGLEPAPTSERIPTALSATLRVPAHDRPGRARFRQRAQFAGVTLALATIIGGTLSWRSSQAHGALTPLAATPLAATPVAAARLVQSAPLAPVSSERRSTVLTSEPTGLSSSAVPSAVQMLATPSARPAPTVKRITKSAGRNAWDPKSFGGRL